MTLPRKNGTHTGAPGRSNGTESSETEPSGAETPGTSANDASMPPPPSTRTPPDAALRADPVDVTRDAPTSLPVPDGLVIREVGTDALDVVRALNRDVFGDTKVINTFDRDGLLILVAEVDGTPAGFKVGYRLDATRFYSAKGGVASAFRRQGIARALLRRMLDVVRNQGYASFVYDTFPNKHPGMTVLGLSEAFTVIKAGYSPQYQDYRLRFEKKFNEG